MAESLFDFPPENHDFLGKELIDKHIEIYWDGDDVYYPAYVKDYNEETGKHIVAYDSDGKSALYDEDLKESKWKIWVGTNEQYETYKVLNVS